jgi:hypothetical protein
MNQQTPHIKMKTILYILTYVILNVGSNLMANDFYAYYTRLPFDDKISDKHADIVVSYGDIGQFVFSRESSYLPRWESGTGINYVTERVPRKGDGYGIQPDKYNRHSYVRIIKNTADEILIHWRYYPDFLKTNMTDVVHEFYSFNPEGRVERIVKQGTDKIDDWKSNSGILVEYLSLSEYGMSSISQKRPVFSEDMRKITSQIRDNSIGKPAAYFHFNEGLSDSVTEYISGIQYPIQGHKSYWTKGVSGSALKFDGYFSAIEVPGAYSPRISTELTLEAWIAMAAHPFGWVPIITQSNWKRAGYYLGINAYGEIGFMFNINGTWSEYKTKERIDIKKWYHVAVTLSEKSGNLVIYLDGKPLLSEKIEFKDNLMLIHANAPLSIGLNNDLLSPLPNERYSFGQYASHTGFEGVIDEVRLFKEALSQGQILESYQKLAPAEENLYDTGFLDRILPGHPGAAEKFGAIYTNLKYHDLWDNAWRSSKYPDILVKFDQLPTSVTFWRGPSFGAGWVTENNLWMVDQSVESGNGVSYGEHMSDKQGRYSHVRLIENTDARVVVHWRYALNDVLYSFIKEYGDAGVWIDEYMTIYPDGVGIRKVNHKAIKSELDKKPIFWEERPTQKISWQDVQFLSQPGMTPDEVMNLEAVHLANLKGETATMDWSNGVPAENPLPSANIELINFKSEYKVFLAFPEGIYINPWGRIPEEMYCHFMTWNHWPVAFINSQGKRSLFPTRVTHSALCAADNTVDFGNMAMYGFTNSPVLDLVPLVRCWDNAPKLNNISGCQSLGYRQEQRSYELIAEDDIIEFDINASVDSPLVNPCFVIKNIESSKINPELEIDGKEILAGKDFRKGISYDTDGKPMLIIWLKLNIQKDAKYKLKLLTR